MGGLHKFTVRFANKDDMDFIYQSLTDMSIERNLSDRFSQSKESLAKALFSQSHFAEVLIAEWDNHPSGLCLFSMTKHNFDFFRRSTIYVHVIYVLPDYRRMGIEKDLANRMAGIAKDRHCYHIDGAVMKDIEVVDCIDPVRAKL